MSERRTLQFSPSLWPVAAVVAFVSAVAALSVVAHLSLLGPDVSAYPDHLSALLSLPFFTLMFLGTWWTLRAEGVSLSAIGLDASGVLPAVLGFGLVWVTSTLGGLGYLLATGSTDAVGFAVEGRWYWTLLWFVLTLTVSNGLTEEFVFRGYLQSKCSALASGRSWLPDSAVGIVAAAILFGVPHIPLGMLALGVPPRATPWIILGNLVPGIAYGIVYYLTQNLWYTGLVHGFGNATLVPFDQAAVPFFTPLTVAVGMCIALGYRYRARTDSSAVRPRKTTASE